LSYSKHISDNFSNYVKISLKFHISLQKWEQQPNLPKVRHMRSLRLLPTVLLFTLVLLSVATPQAQSQSTESSLPYVYSNDTFPPYRATVARHTLRLAVPINSPSVSALKLTAPAGFTLNRRVEVFNHKTGEKLPVNVNLDRQTVELSFDRAVAPGTAIDVELNNVRVWGLEKHYDLAVKFTDNSQNVSDAKSQVANDRYINLGRTGLRRS
jgi:Protein of unknown function (DUF2808)